MPVRKPPTLLDTPERAEAAREAYHSTRDVRRNGITGFVLLELTVAKDGNVESVRSNDARTHLAAGASHDIQHEIATWTLS
jgi:hypothetical protein